jgi:hypothetical protein
MRKKYISISAANGRNLDLSSIMQGVKQKSIEYTAAVRADNTVKLKSPNSPRSSVLLNNIIAFNMSATVHIRIDNYFAVCIVCTHFSGSLPYFYYYLMT